MQQGAGKALQFDPLGHQGVAHRALLARRPGFVAATAIHPFCAYPSAVGEQRLGRIAGAQGERAAALANTPLQAAQAVMQPPAAGAARRPLAGGVVIAHVNRRQRLRVAMRRAQGGEIGKAQVLAEPEDGGAHGVVPKRKCRPVTQRPRGGTGG